MNVLVTGVRSGLGKAAFLRFGGLGLERANRDEVLRRAASGVDAVVHCAASPPPPPGAGPGALGRLREDNVGLTRDLAALPAGMFIFISTVDVYPVEGGPWREDAALPEPAAPYPATKLAAEEIVRARFPRHLILRASALLGEAMRRNTLSRMLSDAPCRLTLTADSTLNYVRHEDVLDLAALGLSGALSGTVNAASAAPATLEQLAALVGRPVEFGGHRYRTPAVDNARAAAAHAAFRRTTADTVRAFLAARRERTP